MGFPIAEISLLELLGVDPLLNNGSVRRPVCIHWPLSLPPFLHLHHAGLLLAAGMLPHFLQLLPQYHFLQVQGGWYSHCGAVCAGHDSRVSMPDPSAITWWLLPNLVVELGPSLSDVQVAFSCILGCCLDVSMHKQHAWNDYEH